MTMRHAARRPLRVGLLAAILTGLLVHLPGTALAATSGGWSSLGHGATATAPALNGPVFGMTRVGTTLYLGGTFDNAGGIAAADRVAKWNGSAWSAVGAGMVGEVRTIAVDGSNVYVGGAFQNAGGDANADHLAVWNGSAWHALQGVASNGEINSLVIIGRTLYIGGTFANLGGVAEADGVAAFGLDSHAVTAITDQSGDIGPIYSMVPDGSGGLYVGGPFINADGIDAADRVAHWTGGTSWSPLGGIPLNGAVRGLARSGADLYVLGDFTNANAIGEADKVARYDGTWHSLGSTSALGEGNVTLYDAVVDGSTLFVVGNFLNANGVARADAVASFDGATWTNVGTNADGSNGPAAELRTVEILGSRIYAGGIANIGGSSMNAGVASFRLRQPDARIRTTGAFVGNGVYNTTGTGQTRTRNANQGATATFTVVVENDGAVTDSIKVQGSGSGGGFTVRYLAGTLDITSVVVAGNVTYPNMVPGETRTLTVKVKVGSGVANSATHTFAVTFTSLGGGAAKDVVKAKVKAI